MSSETRFAQPLMAMMRCEAMRPMNLEQLSGAAIEDGEGALGVGVDVVDGEPMLFVSAHASVADAIFARLDLDTAQAFVALLIRHLGDLARYVPGQPTERPN